ncbi:hypothetical protein G3I44_04090 [Halogeometricum borinquense]|uniref:Uncharacterized protein n=1 Tax=Halogeometricum borinquense TaxID=60847 RepID=A0A6C0UG40_9EURY|nr:hypothetical protein [Halogeometricum borinquense]QIB73533.1 hypothetical protein G3I44_04090 [Halogeometricum borinquense]
MNRYGLGLDGFQDNSSVPFKPIIEVVDQDINIEGWQGQFEQSFIEFPRYLNERSTRYDKGGLNALMERYNASPVQYYTAHKSKIEIPVIASPSIRPPAYKAILDFHRELQDQFNRLAVRLFVPAGTLTAKQEQNLDAILEELRSEDFLLLDIVDSADFSKHLYERVQSIIDRADNQETYVLNAFEPQDGQRHNLGPVLTQRFDLDGFGDFVTDPRFPSGGGSSEEQSSIIRQYSQGRYEVREYKKETYPEAFKELLSEDEFDPDHCEFCSLMVEEESDWATQWKIYRMGHYIHTILEETLPKVETESPEELDTMGETLIRELLNDDDET